jgi:hypothetical protein
MRTPLTEPILRAQCGLDVDADRLGDRLDNACRAGASGSDTATAIDGLADDVRMAGVPSRFLDHVERHPPKVATRHRRPRATRVKIEGAEDLPWGGDLLPVVGCLDDPRSSPTTDSAGLGRQMPRQLTSAATRSLRGEGGTGIGRALHRRSDDAAEVAPDGLSARLSARHDPPVEAWRSRCTTTRSWSVMGSRER